MIRLVRKENVDKKLDKTFVNFYIVLDNGNRIQVKNAFKDDFTKLLLIAEKE